MADPISGNFDKNQIPRLDQTTKASAENAEVNESETSVDSTRSNEIRDKSSVQISPEAQKSIDLAVFDREKVKQIKEAIENNSYPLDNKKMAESFVPLERLISD
ncbi:MAG: hypothetical protein CMQ41_02750 [Gammaproteobacteria bacterium]|nr:hypothetical protein [Gammaproteobacteria bacterium]|tara:strand:- start:9 stop:320 length:312 start_codon:yes stop_codon:yes gene_type:complete